MNTVTTTLVALTLAGTKLAGLSEAERTAVMAANAERIYAL